MCQLAKFMCQMHKVKTLNEYKTWAINCRSRITPNCCTGCVELVKRSFLHLEPKAELKEGEGEMELLHFVGLNSKNLVLNLSVFAYVPVHGILT